MLCNRLWFKKTANPTTLIDASQVKSRQQLLVGNKGIIGGNNSADQSESDDV